MFKDLQLQEFVDFATAGRHRGFSNIYIQRQLFQQSKLGPDVELQNTHIVFSSHLEICIKSKHSMYS